MRRISVEYARGHTGVVLEVARALAFGIGPGRLMTQGIPVGIVRRAQRYLGIPTTV